jgi:hypothetical protein
MMNEMRRALGSDYGSGMEFAADPILPKNSGSARMPRIAKLE